MRQSDSDTQPFTTGSRITDRTEPNASRAHVGRLDSSRISERERGRRKPDSGIKDSFYDPTRSDIESRERLRQLFLFGRGVDTHGRVERGVPQLKLDELRLYA
jgi:hypothetical protein